MSQLKSVTIFFLKGSQLTVSCTHCDYTESERILKVYNEDTVIGAFGADKIIGFLQDDMLVQYSDLSVNPWMLKSQ